MSIKSKLKNNNVINKLYQKIIRFKFCLYTVISPKLNTKVLYKKAFGKKLDLDNPKTLNEKILWLKLNRYMKDPLVIKCVDKYCVREYVTECGCQDILNELIGVYDRAKDIPWEELPEQFALKWNFGAGMNIICTDKSKMNKNEVIKQMKKWGKCKYWLPNSEMQYKYMAKKIICEKLICTEKEEE